MEIRNLYKSSQLAEQTNIGVASLAGDLVPKVCNLNSALTVSLFQPYDGIKIVDVGVWMISI